MDGVPHPPDPWGASAALLAQGAAFVVVGGFAVIANEHIRATKDVDFLIPDDADNDGRCLRAMESLGARLLREGRSLTLRDFEGDYIGAHSSAGIIDLIREGLPPIDFETVAAAAHRVDSQEGEVLVAGLVSVVAMKRLAGRPQDLARDRPAICPDRHLTNSTFPHAGFTSPLLHASSLTARLR